MKWKKILVLSKRNSVNFFSGRLFTYLLKCTLGARGFLCAVSAFGQVLKSEWLRRSCLRPLAEHVSACGRQNEAPRRTREKTSGTQGSQNDGQTETLSGPMVILTGHCPLTGCYFEPWNPHWDRWICPLLLKLIYTCLININIRIVKTPTLIVPLIKDNDLSKKLRD